MLPSSLLIFATSSAMGLPFHFEAGEGPVIEKPIREREHRSFAH